MKRGLSGIELKFLVAEWQELVGARVTKIYQPAGEEVYFQFHGTGSGKKLLRIMPPGFMFFTEFKEESPQKPHGFCQNLRKWLEGAEITEIRQIGLERIVEIMFSTGAGRQRLVVELFAKGNIILCNEDYVIISCLSSHKFKDRDIRPKQKYIFPQEAANPYKLSKQDYEKIMSESPDDAVGAIIATKIGLGPTYSNEVCFLSGIEKSKKNLSKEEREKIYATVWTVLARGAKPNYIPNTDAVPIELQAYQNFERIYFESYNEALDKLLTTATKERAKRDDKLSIEKERVAKIIETQSAGIARMEEEIEENRTKAGLIYEHYQEIKETIEKVNSDIKKLSRKELLEKYPHLTEVNLKDKTIILKL